MRPHIAICAFIALLMPVSGTFSQTFSPSTIAHVPGIHGTVSVGDFDNDDNDDLLLAGGEFNEFSLRVFTLENGDFFERTETGLPIKAKSAEWLDYDHDGDLDAFVVKDSFDLARADFYINTDGKFVPLHTKLPKLDHAIYYVSDYDSDEDFDILMCGIKGPNLEKQTFLLKNVDDVFTPVPDPPFVDLYGGASWHDYDKDGDVDLLSIGRNTSVLYTNENNNLVEFSDFAVASDVRLDWADFDKDGDDDLLMTGFGSDFLPFVKVYQQGEDHNLTHHTPIVLGNASALSAKWIDYDMDGDIDLFHSGFTMDGNGLTQLWDNNNGTFTKIEYFGIPLGILATFIDYDKDNDYDLFAPDHNFSARIYRNNGKTNPIPLDGRPEWPMRIVGHSSSTTTIDLMWSDLPQTEDSYHIELQVGDGPFNEIDILAENSFQYTATGLSPNVNYSFRLRTKNESGYSKKYSNTISLTTASSDFVKIESIPSLAADASAWFDMDNDGDLDLIYSGYASQTEDYEKRIHILRNDNGNFVQQTHNLPTMVAYDISASDYDHDGDQDMLMAGIPSTGDDAQTRLFVNNGNFAFSAHPAQLLGVRHGFARWVDINSDGYLDIFLSGTYDGNNTVHHAQMLINKRDNTFEEIFNTGVPYAYQSDLEVSDFNGDGKVDLLLGGYAKTETVFGDRPSTKLYLNNGNNSFSLHQEFSPTSDGSVEAGDLDSDGDMDIITSGEQRETRIYWNQAGQFVRDTQNSLFGFVYGNIALGDIDNDGDLDIVMGGDLSEGLDRVAVFINNGTGIFSESGYGLVPLDRMEIALGDFDGDGDLDLFQAGYSWEQKSFIFRNDIDVVNQKPS